MAYFFNVFQGTLDYYQPSGTVTWTLGEHLTIAGDNVTVTLASAPNSIVNMRVDRQPQEYNLDYTGIINGVNKTFVFTSPVDASLQTLLYADYS